ncbi:hypothetical protein EsH8_IV_001244 [Colletotrichum jinshuiense]
MNSSDPNAAGPSVRDSTTVPEPETFYLSIVPVARHKPHGAERGNGSVPLSLNQLKAGEMIQRVHDDANQLLNNMQGLLQSNFSTGDSKRSSVPGVVFSDPDLLVAQRLSQHIAGGMDELVALSHKSARDMERSLGMPPPYKVRRLHKTDSTGSYHSPKPRRSTRLICHSCHVTSTPQWRNGPAGHCTLCNVCGLMYAKRLHKHGHSIRSPHSSLIS